MFNTFNTLIFLAYHSQVKVFSRPSTPVKFIVQRWQIAVICNMAKWIKQTCRNQMDATIMKEIIDN